MPGQLANGAVVDVWAFGAPVAWTLPSKAARGGRWRSFPMASQMEGASFAELERVYGYLCREWNGNGTCVSGDTDPGQRLVRFKAYMLRAPFDDTTQVTKRHLHTQECP
jgi:hypothetical protein